MAGTMTMYNETLPNLVECFLISHFRNSCARRNNTLQHACARCDLPVSGSIFSPMYHFVKWRIDASKWCSVDLLGQVTPWCLSRPKVMTAATSVRASQGIKCQAIF